MKQAVLFLLAAVMFVYAGCDSSNSSVEPLDSAIPSSIVMSDDIESFFSPTKVAEIRLSFTVSEWNGLLNDFDKYSKNETFREASCSVSGGNISSASPKSFASVGVRLRGNTSRIRPEIGSGSHNSSNLLARAHFKIKFNNKFDKDESVYGSADVAEKSANKDQQLFDGIKALNLKYNRDDPSYIREGFSYDMYRRFGVEHVRMTFTKLYITIGSELPRYIGVYLAFEDIDKTFMQKRFFDPSGEGLKGAMFKCLWQQFGPADLTTQDTDGSLASGAIGEEYTDPLTAAEYNSGFSDYRPAYDLKEDPAGDAVASLNSFIEIINSKPSRTQLEAVFDVPQFLRALAVEAMVEHTDSYWRLGNNYYLYKNPLTGKWTYMPYDNDRTFGVQTGNSTSASTSVLNWGEDSGFYDNDPVLIHVIMAFPEYRELYKTYLRKLVEEEYFTTTVVIDRMKAMQAVIAPCVSGYDVGNDNFVYYDSISDFTSFVSGRVAVVKKECY
jgi:spore coat protein CotH